MKNTMKIMMDLWSAMEPIPCLYGGSAFLFWCRIPRKPIVVTGAQKPIDLEITDARTNLSDSLRFASSDKAYGVTIVFDGKVIAGTRGKKKKRRATMPFPVSISLILQPS